MWIIVKEKTTVDHKLCIWPSAIKNVNLRCSKEKIKGYKRNLTSILSTKQGKGSVLIHLAGLYTKDGQPWRNHTLFWRPCAPGRASRVRRAPPQASQHTEEPDPDPASLITPPCPGSPILSLYNCTLQFILFSPPLTTRVSGGNPFLEAVAILQVAGGWRTFLQTLGQADTFHSVSARMSVACVRSCSRLTEYRCSYLHICKRTERLSPAHPRPNDYWKEIQEKV